MRPVEPTSQSAQADAGHEESEQSDTVAPVLEDTPPKEGPKRRGWFSRARMPSQANNHQHV